MQIDQLQHGAIVTIALKPADADRFDPSPSPGAECALVRAKDGEEIFLSLPGADENPSRPRAQRVIGHGRRDRERLEEVIGRDLLRIAYVLKPPARAAGKAPGGLVVRVHEFHGQAYLPDRVEAGLYEEALRQLRRVLPHMSLDPEKMDTFLRERLLLPPARPDGPPRAVVCASPDKALAEQRGFRVLGNGLTVDLARDRGGKLLVKRVRTGTRVRRDDARPLVLAELDLHFKDASVAAEFRGMARSVLEQLAERGESYLAFWKAYNDLEERTIAGEARAFLWLRYTRVEPTHRGTWVFEIPGAGDQGENGEDGARRLERVLEKNLTLEARPKVPSALRRGVAGPDAGASASPDEPVDDEDANLLDELRAGEKTFAGTIQGLDERTGSARLELNPIAFEEQPEPPERGVLIVSVTGDAVRLSRRKEAESAIRMGVNPMPQLGMILENQPAPVGRHHAIQVKRSVVEALIGAAPTETQMEAIRIALNTPDIAVIQGPFGTGKTQVIAAIHELIARNEENQELSGSMLLTSFQHDAVENAVSRTVVLGLPAVKVGTRRGQREDIDPARTWRQDTVRKLREKLDTGSRPAANLYKEIARMAIRYSKTPGDPSHVARDLRRLHDLATGRVPPDLLNELVETAQRLERGSSPGADDDPQRVRLRKAVLALRTTEVSFGDDGPKNASKLLLRARNASILSREDEVLLEKAAAWNPGDPLPFLPGIESLRNRLLDALTDDTTPPVTPASDPRIEALFARVVDALGDDEARSREGVTAARWDYLEDLENDPIATTETLKEYTAVLAATCQQSAGRGIRLAKDIRPGDGGVRFRTVVIDEAARANPLDLFIPLAVASRRIVLVGDHKQLPHLLEPDLEQHLEKTVSDKVLASLRESLFQRLYGQLQAREGADGVRRTIMLDTQFRMHPVLGTFLSKHFYDGSLKSGRPPEDFAHALPGYSEIPAQDRVVRHVHSSHAMAWLDVPSSRGFETRGRSKKREVEARAVAREVRRLLHHCDSSSDPTERDLTFGIIAFYRAQVDALWRALVKEEVAIEEDGQYRVHQRYRRLEDGRERVRVGTVDAFQGKEFDVVFLSMTRANALPDDTEQDRRRRYGHLMLPNRLNVAMSRQKRLLIVAGASDMVRRHGAKEAVPALVDSYEMCMDGRSR